MCNKIYVETYYVLHDESEYFLNVPNKWVDSF